MMVPSPENETYSLIGSQVKKKAEPAERLSFGSSTTLILSDPPLPAPNSRGVWLEGCIY